MKSVSSNASSVENEASNLPSSHVFESINNARQSMRIELDGYRLDRVFRKDFRDQLSVFNTDLVMLSIPRDGREFYTISGMR